MVTPKTTRKKRDTSSTKPKLANNGINRISVEVAGDTIDVTSQLFELVNNAYAYRVGLKPLSRICGLMPPESTVRISRKLRQTKFAECLHSLTAMITIRAT